MSFPADRDRIAASLSLDSQLALVLPNEIDTSRSFEDDRFDVFRSVSPDAIAPSSVS